MQRKEKGTEEKNKGIVRAKEKEKERKRIGKEDMTRKERGF